VKLIMPIGETIIRQMAEQGGSESAAAKVLAEGEEIKARGSQVRYWLTDEPGLCCQEGVAFTSTSEQ
jgi:hypothetical protein